MLPVLGEMDHPSLDELLDVVVHRLRGGFDDVGDLPLADGGMFPYHRDDALLQ